MAILTPPADLGAERAVLGSILVDSSQGLLHMRAIEHIITDAEMYYEERHRLIWRSMLALGDTLDPRSLISDIKARGALEHCGGEVYILRDLVDAVGTAAHVQHYARIVARTYYERRIIQESRRMAASPDPASIEPLRDLVLAREQMIAAAPAGDIRTVLGDMVHNLDNPAAQRRIMTGYQCWDILWSGMFPGEVNTWAAATNEGKSVLLLNLMLRAARAGHRCLIFGTEMSAAELSQRMIAIHGNLSARAIRRGIDPKTRDRYIDTCEALSKLPITIVDDPEPSLADIEVAVSTHGTEVLYLDYLERFAMPQEDNLRLRIREFMRRLKNLARRRGLVVHLAAQLNRMAYPATGGGGEKKDRRPVMSMLAESAAIEKESDRVMLMWAPKSRQAAGAVDTQLEIVGAKNKHGARGVPTSLTMSGVSLCITEPEMDPDGQPAEDGGGLA